MKKFLTYAAVILLIAYVSISFVWPSYFADQAKCEGVTIHIQQNDSTNFLSSEFIINELKQKKFKMTDLLLNEIDLDSLESFIKAKEYIEDANCYFTGNLLNLDIVPIQPILRLLHNGEFYYVNKSGKRIKANPQYFIDLPIVKYDGETGYKFDKLIPMLDHIEKDEFLHNLVSMIEIADTNNIFIIPSITGHVVNMGSIDNYESKFVKLKRFYNEVMNVKGWDAYELITLKWDHQIVAKRRNAHSRLTIEEYDPEFDEISDDIETSGLTSNIDDGEKTTPGKKVEAKDKPKAENAEKADSVPKAKDKKDEKSNEQNKKKKI